MKIPLFHIEPAPKRWFALRVVSRELQFEFVFDSRNTKNLFQRVNAALFWHILGL